MFRTRFGWTALLLVVALGGGSWVLMSRESLTGPGPVEGLSEAPIAGYLAPNFELQNTIGETVTMADFRGRPLVLNFWASWCPPCRVEVPHFQEASVKFHGRAAVVGIDQGEPLAPVADFGAAFGISYPLLLDPDNAVNREYGIVALPTTIFVDSRGVIREVYTGIVNLAVLEDRIERLLAEG